MSSAPAWAQTIPAHTAVEITASSTAFARGACRAIHANTSETITVDFANGATGVDLVVVAGMTYPYSLIKITTGTAVVALY